MSGKRGNTGMSAKHGLCREGVITPEYRALSNIKTRCLNAKTRSFYRYGGRGIEICDRWVNGEGNLSGIECFVDDLGNRPSPAHSVERIDNDGHYEPGNCRWALPREQSNNTRRNVRIEMGGSSYTLADACRTFGLSYNHLYKRVTRKGWTLAQVIEENSNV